MTRQPYFSPDWHRVAELRPRLRPHVAIQRHRYQGRTWYVIQDHLSGRYHRFTPAAYAFVGLMDGRRRVAELWREMVDRLGDEAPSQSEVVTLLAQLHAADLLETDVAADASELQERRSRMQRRRTLQRVGNPIAFRIPLWNPDRFLRRTLPIARLLLSPFGAILWLLVVGAGLGLAMMHWDRFGAGLSDRLLSADGLLLSALVFPVLKLIHEFGHGYAARAGGAAVREMGVILIALAPIPYVDASGASAFRSKWRRAAVGAAGVIAESFVAGLAMLAWSLLEPGPARAVAVHVVLVAGVSTVLFNLNPLLRFDGYFILCDLLEIPNLGSRANRWWGWLVERHVFGADVESPPTTAWERVWFAIYAPASFVWRIVVLIGIALFVAQEYFVVGVLIALFGLALGLVWPALKALWHVATAPRIALHRGRAVGLTMGGVAASLAALLLVPAPLRTMSEGVVWLPEEAIVRAGADGFVRRLAQPPGSRVVPGMPLIEAEHPDLAAREVVLRAQLDALRAKLDSEQFADRVRAAVTREEIALKVNELAQVQERLAALRATAQTSGVFHVPRAEDLPGRFVKRGDVLGFVLPERAAHVRVVVPQADIALVRERLRGVELALPGRVWEPLPSLVLREIPAASERLPSRALAVDGGGRFAAEPAAAAELPKALERMFQFDLALPEEAAVAAFGARVMVRFEHGVEPLGLQWWRRGRQLLLARLDV